MKNVRVRFAPSPTGALHIGGVRTALYNYLFARQMGGKFILRIEDTDSQRFVPGAEDYIIKSLEWCGITIDEGVSVGGPHAPYRQSERREIYLKYALQLVTDGWAYYAFDTPEELDAIRKEQETAGKTFSYNYTIRQNLSTSLKLSPEEVQTRIDRGDQWVIRFKMPENTIIKMNDLVRGEVNVNSSTLDDKVLYKSADALPTYHLANIVDDKLMEISHVIRGEEWLPSLPLHFMLYKAFGWSEVQPQFAHLPLLLKPEGNGKLSKRDGDKLGFPVFPLEWTPQDGTTSRGYKEDGYLPQAFLNMLALLGWNPGDDKEIMSIDEMISLFSIDKVSKAGARFSPQKALWFNEQYLRALPNEELAQLLDSQLKTIQITAPKEKVAAVVELVRARAVLIPDLLTLAKFYFVAPTQYDEKVVQKFWKNENPTHLKNITLMLTQIDDFTALVLDKALHDWIQERELPMGQVMNTLRLSIVGASGGASLPEILEIIGKEDALQRMNNIQTVLKTI